MKAKYSYEKEELQIDFKDIRKTIKILPQKHQTARVSLALVLVFLGPRVIFKHFFANQVFLWMIRAHSDWISLLLKCCMSLTVFPVQLPVQCRWSALCCWEVLNAPNIYLHSFIVCVCTHACACVCVCVLCSHLGDEFCCCFTWGWWVSCPSSSSSRSYPLCLIEKPNASNWIDLSLSRSPQETEIWSGLHCSAAHALFTSLRVGLYLRLSHAWRHKTRDDRLKIYNMYNHTLTHTFLHCCCGLWLWLLWETGRHSPA